MPDASDTRQASVTEVAYTLGSHRCTQDHRTQQHQFSMDNAAQFAALRITQLRHHSLFQRLIPLQESHGRMDGNQADDDEQDYLDDERRAVHIVVSAFFKVHQTQTTDDQNQASGDAVDGVVALDFFCRG